MVDEGTVIKIIIFLAVTGCLLPVISIILQLFKTINHNPVSDAFGAVNGLLLEMETKCDCDPGSKVAKEKDCYQGVEKVWLCDIVMFMPIYIPIGYALFRVIQSIRGRMNSGEPSADVKSSIDAQSKSSGKSEPEVSNDLGKIIQQAQEEYKTQTGKEASDAFKDYLSNRISVIRELDTIRNEWNALEGEAKEQKLQAWKDRAAGYEKSAADSPGTKEEKDWVDKNHPIPPEPG